MTPPSSKISSVAKSSPVVSRSIATKSVNGRKLILCSFRYREQGVARRSPTARTDCPGDRFQRARQDTRDRRCASQCDRRERAYWLPCQGQPRLLRPTCPPATAQRQCPQPTIADGLGGTRATGESSPYAPSRRQVRNPAKGRPNP